jgi:hypothetical protein
MKRPLLTLFSILAIAFTMVLSSGSSARSASSALDSKTQKEIAIGYKIAPVHLNLSGKDKTMVGLGSYLVNAQASCVDCHSCPTYAQNGNPFFGQPKQFNKDTYLSGGVPFGSLRSDNITPDSNGLPAGLTLTQFLQLMRTGMDPNGSGDLLQVMPWPHYQDMTTYDLQSIYAYLTAIPSAQTGTSCSGPGQ